MTNKKASFFYLVEIYGYTSLGCHRGKIIEHFGVDKVYDLTDFIHFNPEIISETESDAEFFLMKNILEVIPCEDIRHVICSTFDDKQEKTVFDYCGHDFLKHFKENYSYELKETIVPNYIPNMQWKDMVEASPDYEKYLFWNKNKSKHQGIFEFTVDFLSWGKTGKAKGIHLFLDVGGDKVWVYIQWWSKFYKKNWMIDKVYLGNFHKSHFECKYLNE